MAYKPSHSLAVCCTLSLVFMFGVAVPVCTSLQTHDIYPESTCLNRTTNNTCLTLSDIANKQERYFTSNSTLVFHNGDHILQDEVVSVSNVTNFTVKGYSSDLVSPLSTVKCINSSLSFSNVFLEIASISFNHCSISLWQANAVVHDTSFENGRAVDGAALAIHYSRVWFDGISTFAGNMAERYGGGIFTNWSNLTFSGSTLFTGNKAIRSYYYVKGGGALYCAIGNLIHFSGNSTFMSNTAADRGGAVFAGESNTVSFNSKIKFISNTADHGGAVYAYDSNSLSFYGDSSFVNNRVEKEGGAVAVLYSNIITFIGNTTFMNNGGRVVITTISFSTGVVSYTVEGNTADHGGAVYVRDNNTLRFSGESSFINNTAVDYGGALNARDGNTLNFSGNCSFANNTAYRGGAVYVRDSNTLRFSGSNSFMHNTARKEGGAVWVRTGNTLNFRGNSSFNDNAAVFHAGALLAYDSNTVIFRGDSSFVSNGAQGSGGAVRAERSNNLSFIRHTRFVSNTAEHYSGGAVYVHVSNTLTFSGHSHFMNNGRALRGGALYANDDNTLSFDGNSYFMSNTAVFGGAVSGYEKNRFSFSGDSAFLRNTASKRGGAVYVNGTNDLSFNGNSDFANNTAEYGGALSGYVSNSFSFSGGSSFSCNTASNRGGAVHASNTNNWSFNGNSHFLNNSAEYGGAVCASYGNTWSIGGDGSFISNMAKRGGAVFVQQSNTMTFSGNSFMNNAADYSSNGTGGAVYASGNNTLIFIFNNSFTSNTACYGGAVYARDNNTFSFCGDNSFTDNVADDDGGAIYTKDCNSLTFNGKSIFMYSTAVSGGAVYAYNSNTLRFSGNSTFVNNTALSGGALASKSGNTLYFSDSISFTSNTAGYRGGAVYAFDDNSLSFSGDATLMHNTAEYGGAVYTSDSTVRFDGHSTFICNTVSGYGGALYSIGGISSFSESIVFMSNAAEYGGAVAVENGNRLDCSGDSTFVNNTASFGGTVFATNGNTLSFNGSSSLMNNTASHSGGAVYAEDTNTLSFNGSSSLTSNTARRSGGAVYAEDTNTLSFNGDSYFVNNTAVLGGAVSTCDSNTLVFSGESSFVSNTAEYGGAVAIKDSLITFNGNTNIEGNEAEQGGGIFLSSRNMLTLVGCVLLSSNVAVFGGGAFVQDGSIQCAGSIGVTGNTAYKHGGGLFVNSSTVGFNGAGHFQNNVANERGGAIFTNSSTVIFRGSFQITENTAELGGGLALYFGTFLFEPETDLFVDSNLAHRHGGAAFLKSNPFIFSVIEETGSKVCLLDRLEESYSVNRKIHLEPTASTTLKFHNNTALESGDTLYGEHLGACIVCTLPQGLDLNMQSFQCSSENRQANQTARNITLYPGQVMLLPLVVVGQTNLSVSSASNPVSEDSKISSEFIPLQPIKNSELQYHFYTHEVCSSLQNPLGLYFEFHSECPLGFPHYEEGTCICDKRLQKYTQNCNLQTLTISRLQGDTFWVGVEGSEGLILHPHCPFDYCTTESTTFTLNTTSKYNGTSMQCANGRSGILCGACQPGYSLSLGSSQCLSGCSNEFLTLVIAFAFAGVVFVAFLFMCRITVAEGTLSGLIFYANILAVNQTVFFPSGEQNPLTVFIAWFNLDFGIETCFFESLDTYYSTWLQFAFPVYIWVIVGVIIVLADRSTFFAKIIGNTNPVAVLATLFLLSYTKLLRAIMAAFSFTTLDYPDDNSRYVWLYDGNIGYLDGRDGRHIILFLFSLLFLVFIFLPYTLLLFCGQWIQRKLWWLSPTTRLFLKSFLDAHYGPYKDIHRYWTGLLLLLRFLMLFIATIINIRNPQDPFSNLLVILAVSLVASYWVFRGLYKKWYLDLLEASFLFNLIVLVGGTYHVRQSGGNQGAVVYTSVGIAFVTFLGIVTNAAIQRVKEKLPDCIWTAIRHQFMRNKQNQNSDEHSIPSAIPMTTVTHSVVGIGDTRTEHKAESSTHNGNNYHAW